MDSNTPFTLEQQASTSMGAFTYPLYYLLERERNHSMEDRRSLYLEDPPWRLLFRNRYYAQALDFIHTTLCLMVDASEGYPTFHTETGILSKYFVEYLRSVDDVDKAIHFADTFRAYVRGERKRMPRNVSDDVGAYEHLKNLIQTPYTKKLIREFKAKGDKASLSQDFVVLFKMPTYALLETVFGSMTDEEVVFAIESYR